MSRTSSPPAGKRAHKRTLADGTVKIYLYDRKPAAPVEGAAARYAPDTMGALIIAYRRSPEWDRLAPATRSNYLIYHREVERLGHMRVADVTRRLLLDMRDALAQTRGPAAGNHFARVASYVLGYGVDRGWIPHNPMRGARGLRGGHLPAWTAEQADRAMRELPAPLARVVLLGLYTGQRRGDLVALPWSAYDGRAIRLTQGKTGAQLVIPAHAVLRAALDNWRRTAADETILVSPTGRPWRPVELSQKLPAALRRIGLPEKLNVHGLRKLAAARLADAGCSVHEIAAITGHRSFAMIALYTASASQERLAEAALARLATGGNAGHSVRTTFPEAREKRRASR